VQAPSVSRYTVGVTDIALSRLLRPLLWLLWLLLSSLVLPIVLGLITPVLLLVWTVGLVLMIASRAFREQMGVTVFGYLLWPLVWPVLLVSIMVPALALVLAASLHYYGQVPPELLQIPNLVYRELPADLRHVLPQPDLSLRDWANVCVFAGIIGFSSNCVYLFLDVPWRLKQIRQVQTLPRSKARSVAVGLAEFEGVVRAAGANAVVSRANPPEAQPFYLEDETGRILVDPRGAAIRAGSLSGAHLQLNEIEAGIRDGERVYVIGFAQPHAPGSTVAPDSDALVVQPLRQSLVSSPIGRLLFPIGNQMADREAPNIFIVDRGRERNVVLRLRMALWDLCVMSTVYLAASLWLVQAVWPWL
jgi:hypothetical protein